VDSGWIHEWEVSTSSLVNVLIAKHDRAVSINSHTIVRWCIESDSCFTAHCDTENN